MADILIKNMEMPKEMECVEILLFSNGHCSFRKHERDEWVEAWAIELPPHGDLKDMANILDTVHKFFHGDCFEVCKLIRKFCPTIVEATE